MAEQLLLVENGRKVRKSLAELIAESVIEPSIEASASGHDDEPGGRIYQRVYVLLEEAFALAISRTRQQLESSQEGDRTDDEYHCISRLGLLHRAGRDLERRFLSAAT